MAKHKVLSTKKLEPSLIEKAKQSGIEIIKQEAIAVHPILSKEKQDEVNFWASNQHLHPVIFTSANSVEAVQYHLKQEDNWVAPNWKVFCIGGKTKEVLSAFIHPENILATADYGKDLAEKIIENSVKEVVFFCGNRRRDELPTILQNAGVTVHEVMVYDTIETPIAAKDDVDGVLFFSPSAAQSFFSVNQLKKSVVCFAIGKTTADSIADFTDNKIVTSESPSQEMMLASVLFYFEHSNCYE
ncbi:MAG: uroporphyrinogen-III synthase [Flavisolibacter sp.]|jgi:uroporphyrinogen-III synthase